MLGHHELWAGGGFQRAGGERSRSKRALSLPADLAESIIAAEPSSLAARRGFPDKLQQYAGTALAPGVVGSSWTARGGTEFWLGLHAEDLPEALAAMRGRAIRARAADDRFAEVFADISDAKGGHTTAHSRRTADSAPEKLAEAQNLDGHA